jgi:glutathione peroxidase
MLPVEFRSDVPGCPRQGGAPMSRITTATIMCLAAAVAVSGCGNSATVASPDQTQSSEQVGSTAVIDHTVRSLEGEELDLTTFRGRPMLIVNTASKCGYTPQYAGLQELHTRYGEAGLVVIAFPSNDFGNQEPGSPEDIRSFCEDTYSVTFPLMEKVATKGPDQAPIYRTLTRETAKDIRGDVRWNFTKFLVDGDGRVVARFDSGVDPLDGQLVAAIEKLLPVPSAEG